MSNRAKTRPRRTRGHNRAVIRAVRYWITAADLESALGWAVHEATCDQLSEIASRSLTVTESVAATYGVTDDTLLFVMSERITAALTVDMMGAENGEPEIGTELDRTLKAINRDLARQVNR